MNRTDAARLAAETVDVLARGGYTAPSGQFVDLRAAVQSAVDGTVAFPPDVSAPPSGSRHTASGDVTPSNMPASITVTNRSTLAACRAWVNAGERPVALNFASARRPGGGFLNGALAQEESLARSSALYACLRDQPMYAFHRARRDARYSDYVIYSPDVPVFRDDEGALLDEPYRCAFITAPAPNANRLAARDRAGLPDVFRTRLHKVLAVAAHFGHTTVILGAWGCGAFGNDPAMVAPIFGAALRGPFARSFSHVEFAILDHYATQSFIRPFRAMAEEKSEPRMDTDAHG